MRASVPLISISPFLSNTLAQSDRPSAFRQVNSARAGLLGHWLQQRESFCHASPVQSALAHSQTLSRRPCDESEEFLRQNAAIAAAWGAAAVPVCEAVPGRNHMSVLAELAQPRSRTHRLALELLGLAT